MRKPAWLKTRLPSREQLAHHQEITNLINGMGLHTVCTSAKCQNLGDCWGKKTTTFLILGDTCTRNCQFCSVPFFQQQDGKRLPLDHHEPEKVATAVQKLNLDYVVITSVDRDDLDDGGAQHFYNVVAAVKKKNRDVKVELLVPDFAKKRGALKTIAQARPNVFAHNIETVRSLTPLIRDEKSSYEGSLEVLTNFKEILPETVIKSGIMLGHGEKRSEIEETIHDLKDAGCEILTISQYLQPTKYQVEVKKYHSPEEFKILADYARKIGFSAVVSGPLIRSSYRAKEVFERIVQTKNQETGD